MICGHCHNDHISVAEVKACYGISFAPSSEVDTPTGKPLITDIKALAKSIPDGSYALQTEAGVFFYRVEHGGPTATGKDWTGWVFLKQLFGSVGAFSEKRIFNKSSEYAALIKLLAADVEGAARLFGYKFVACGWCHSPLTNPQSRAASYGEKCASNHGFWYPTLKQALEILDEVQLEDGSFVRKDGSTHQLPFEEYINNVTRVKTGTRQ